MRASVRGSITGGGKLKDTMPRLTQSEAEAVISVLESVINDILGMKPEDTEAIERAVATNVFPDYSDVMTGYLKLRQRYQK